ncbi:MAG TPA: hypothetical protein VLS89_03605, partial [Candidatus Nanopelagicales bacterium]|nr:hypothetical protein [Candidatus Nanopelagicales bacterium]
MRVSPVFAAGIAWIASTGCAASSSTQSSTAADRAAPAAPTPEPVAAHAAAPAGPSPLPFRLPCEETDLIGCTNGCAEHQVEDCVTLGSLYLRGDIVSIDAERAAKLFREACDENSARGCLLLGDVYHSGLEQGAPEDETAAYRRSCE